MDLDTRQKRASALGLALAALVVLPAPDATLDQADRQQVSFSYSGVAAGAPPTAEPTVLELVGSYSGPLSSAGSKSAALDLVASRG